jgi:hypothetical protein
MAETASKKKTASKKVAGELKGKIQWKQRKGNH